MFINNCLIYCIDVYSRQALEKRQKFTKIGSLYQALWGQGCWGFCHWKIWQLSEASHCNDFVCLSDRPLSFSTKYVQPLSIRKL